MKIESRKCTNTSKIVEYLSEQIHAVIGCDTTSFLHGVGKIKIPKNV